MTQKLLLEITKEELDQNRKSIEQLTSIYLASERQHDTTLQQDWKEGLGFDESLREDDEIQEQLQLLEFI